MTFTEHGYKVDIASPDGGALAADPWSDPRDQSGYSAEDLISLGFVNSPPHMKLIEQTTPLAAVTLNDYDAVFMVGGQLITGQQQYSGTAAARLVIDALGQ